MHLLHIEHPIRDFGTWKGGLRTLLRQEAAHAAVEARHRVRLNEGR
jgi:hypothetical protein